MLDDVQELAATKFRMSDMASLASRPTFQKDLVHHVAPGVPRGCWCSTSSPKPNPPRPVRDSPDDPGRSERAAAVYCTDVAGVRPVGASGGRHHPIREGSWLERAFRDIYTGTQHAFISEKVAMDAASVWLGIVDDQFSL